MKKIWMIAVVMCAALMVACGGGKNSNSVEAEATKRALLLVEAIKSGDQATCEKLRKENKAWLNTLSEADQEKAEAAAEKVGKEAGVL